MSLLNQINENSSYYQNDCFLIGSYVNFVVKLIPLDHFYANIDGITSKTEYWKEKFILQSILCGLLKNEDKIMICSFFKFSMLEHFWGLKWIAWVDIRVVLVFYSFQSVRVDIERELEKWTKYIRNYRILKIYITQLRQPIYVEK